MVFQSGLNDRPVFDKADDLHDSPALRTGPDLLDQSGPVLPVFLRTFIGFQDALMSCQEKSLAPAQVDPRKALPLRAPFR